MTGPDARLVRLAEVGAALKDAALARLRAAAQTCRRLEADIAALDAAARRAEADDDIAVRAVFGENRLRRHLERRAELNAALARARVEEARLIRAAARDFGREEALRRLVDRSGRR